ncbi:MAG: ABC transporter substrate-binding protein, partial [Anaerolineae bacterium]|nr:ABC transporter substrate-binding protein [Anaerolineae bacterium]
MSQRHKLTRRQFLYVSTLATAGAVASACGAPLTVEPTEVPPEPTAAPPTATPKPEAPAATAKPDEPTAVPEPMSKYKEAPMLAALVASGDLPPVDERLPLNPYTVVCRESIGNYGGNLRRGFSGVSDRWGPTKHVDRSLVWLDADMNLVPRLIESWDVSEDAKTFTLHLRKGLKYSDGVELTSADFKWFYDHYATNAELQPGKWTKLTTVDETGSKVLCEAEFPDDYTVVYKFAHPRPLHMYDALRELHGFSIASHYMKQFHMDTTDDKAALEAAVTEAGFNSWTEYFEDRRLFHLNPDIPWATPWIAKNTLSEELFMMERNPYFFGVDPEGNQLPYIDTVTHRLFEAVDVFNLWIVNGEIDFHNRHVNIANYSLFKENEANGDYQVFLGVSAGHDALQLNLATKEPKL